MKVKTKKGKTTAFRFAAEADGKRRAKVDGINVEVVFTASEANRLWPVLKNLADRVIVDVKADKVAKVEVKRGDVSYALAKEEETWKLTAGDEAKPCDVGKVTRYLRHFLSLRAIDVLVGADDRVASPASSLTITDADGTATTLSIGSEKDGKTALRVGDAKVVYLVTKAKAEALTPAADTLLPKAAEEKKE